MFGYCRNCKHWDNSPGLAEEGRGQCTDESANYDENGLVPINGWRGTDPYVGLETGPEFGCARFKGTTGTQ